MIFAIHMIAFSRMLTNSAPPAQSKAGVTFFKRPFKDGGLDMERGANDTENDERGHPTLLRDTHMMGKVNTEPSESSLTEWPGGPRLAAHQIMAEESFQRPIRKMRTMGCIGNGYNVMGRCVPGLWTAL